MTLADLEELLVAKKPAGHKKPGALAMAAAVQRGLSKRAVENVKTSLGLSDDEMARYLRISSKTLSRRRKGPEPLLPPGPSDRLYRFARLFEIAKDVLEGEKEAREWLRAPQIGLGSEVPLDLSMTEAGAREVEELLWRIEYGVLA